jgi:thymidylate synthase
VLFSPQREANPFFHLNEALWMLAGRNDIEWLDQFVGNLSERFGERKPGEPTYLHGAYGYRWRNHFEVDGGGERGRLPDQLDTVVRLLRENYNDRRIVISMWDPIADLAVDAKDVPCNTTIFLRVRQDLQGTAPSLSEQEKRERIIKFTFNSHVLDLTVCCRSNDAIWGAHGANAVQFSVLQEYLAARIGVGIGSLYQFSNNYHAYTNVFKSLLPFQQEIDRYAFKMVKPTRIVTNPESFDEDLGKYFSDHWRVQSYANEFFVSVALPLRIAYSGWRKKKHEQAYAVLSGLSAPDDTLDWIVAAKEWFKRRLDRKTDNIRLEGDQNAG